LWTNAYKFYLKISKSYFEDIFFVEALNNEESGFSEGERIGVAVNLLEIMSSFEVSDLYI
jgi:hypothetical protein